MKIEPNMPWPPRHPEVSKALAEWDAWYTGSGSALDEVYSSARQRPSLVNDGILGLGRTLLWGRTPNLLERDTRLHLPLAADICSASSDLLFGEELGIDWGEGVGEAVTAMDQVLDENSWQALLTEAGELSAALGGVYLRAGWDMDVADTPLASIVYADAALPTFSYGHLQSVAFWEIVEQHDSTVVRHVETHEKGLIRHQVFVGTKDRLGNPANLLDYAATAGLADALTADDYILTGVDRLTAVYVPNMRPAALWRKIPEARYLGRSDFGSRGVTGFFDAADEAWTSWMRDIRHGKSRIFAARSALQGLGAGNGAIFDEDREIYEMLNIAASEDPSIDKAISAQQFPIRTAEHEATIAAAVLAAVQGCGYSGSTFGLDNETAKTATEVGAVRQRTRDTREKKTRYWTPALERFLGVLGDLNAVVFRGPTAGLEPRVSFPAFTTPGPLELAQTAAAMKAASAASTRTLVQLIHPDWDEQQVAEEVALILDETAPAPVMISDPFASTGDDEPVDEEDADASADDADGNAG